MKPLALILALVACGTPPLRSELPPSPDGATQLVISNGTPTEIGVGLYPPGETIPVGPVSSSMIHVLAIGISPRGAVRAWVPDAYVGQNSDGEFVRLAVQPPDSRGWWIIPIPRPIQRGRLNGAQIQIRGLLQSGAGTIGRQD